MTRTPQRDLVCKVFKQTNRALTVQEAHVLAQQEMPSLGLATVYRTVNIEVAEGWLRAVQLPGEPTRYELASKQHHHHFQCVACQQVFDTHGCPGNLDRLVPTEFEVCSHEIVLYGYCPTCRSPQGQPKPDNTTFPADVATPHQQRR
ncbi:transcriptional repressor [Phycisphaerales bacterium AB-hyl4]|uniref:Transcriptional repressor n=1 Tax=Natronomicrosphaera hydrolytica TaxID=3242702 RepID=A0ABV4U837_9BACT